MFSQFAFGGSSSPRFRLPPCKSNHQNPLPEDFTQKSRILMAQNSSISTVDNLQTPKKPPAHEIPILSIEDFQEVSPNAPTLEVQRVLAHEPPILALEDLQNAKSDHLPSKNPPPDRKILQFYRQFGFDQQMLPPSVRNSIPAQQRVRVVSPYFQNPKSTQQEQRIVSRYFQNLELERAPHNEDASVTDHQRKRSRLGDKRKASRSVHKSRTDKRKRRDNSSAIPRTTLSPAELYLEAYRRQSFEDTWKPPPSGIRLLQQDHAFDPWRVLVICMLLNRTTGHQAKEVIPKLFALCPNPKAALEVSQEQIEDVIRPLGLQRKRSRTMQHLSEMYLKESWSHVTQLPGVGMELMHMQYFALDIGPNYYLKITCLIITGSFSTA